MSTKSKHIDHLNAEQIEAYLSGSLSESDMHRIERHLVACDLCNEAMDGFIAVPDIAITSEVIELDDRINQRVKQSDNTFPFLRIAAIAISIIVTSFFSANYIFNELQRPQFTEKRTIKKELLKPEIKKEKVKREDNTIESIKEINSDPKSDDVKLPNIVEAESIQFESSSDFSDVLIEDAVSEEELIVENIDIEYDLSSERSGSQSNYQFENSIQTEEIQNVPPSDSDIIGKMSKERNRKQKKRSSDLSDESPSDTLLIRGKIMDENNEAIPFASISIKDKDHGTTSDFDGNYEIKAESGDELDIEYVGYESKQIIVGSEETVNVSMSSGVALEEVVVSSSKSSDKSYDAMPFIGKTAYDEYLINMLNYPEAAIDADVKGKVIVGFTVDEMGEIKDVRIVKGLGYGCDEEAKRLVIEGPTWKSAFKNGETISQEVKVKVVFK